MGLGMWFLRKTATDDRNATFRDRAERRLFWKNSIVNLRSQAISLQVFGLMAWALSRVFSHPGAYFDPKLTTLGVVGAVCGMTMTYIARHIVVNAVGCGLCALAIALCIHSNVTGTHQAAFWVIPVGVVITVGMAPVFADRISYIISSIGVWLIVSYGQVTAMLHMEEANWIVLMTGSCFGLGILLNHLFLTERRKTFLVQRELIRLSFMDALTGINNRRGLMETLQDIHAIASTGDFYFLLIDVDDFKRINDTSGHDVGDRVLIEVATIITHHANGYPHGRLGGEEFGMVFQGGGGEAQAFAGRICEHVASRSISGHSVTISIGMAQLRASSDLADIVRLADQGLYEAKQQGKNRYVLMS